MNKRIVFILGLFVATVQTVVAQVQCYGVVTDKYGNPLPGATVWVKGTPTTLTTHSDGSFFTELPNDPDRIEVSREGKKTKSVPYKWGMNVKLKNLTHWNERPEKYSLLVGFAAAHNLSDMMPMGVRVGLVKQFGFYAQAMTTGTPSSIGSADISNRGDVFFTMRTKKTGTMISGGPMVRLWSPLHFYAGAGWAHSDFFVEHISGPGIEDSDGYVKATDRSKSDLLVDGGLLLTLPYCYVNAGGSLWATEGGFWLHFGLGVKL